jgi:hypothetical protein
MRECQTGLSPSRQSTRRSLVQLPRQVCYLSGEEHHLLPGNAGLPAHEGQVTTRGLQEWACLLPQDLPFGTAERLLSWMVHAPQVISETQGRRLVCAHGQVIREAEKAEVQALLERPNLKGCHRYSRRPDRCYSRCLRCP